VPAALNCSEKSGKKKGTAGSSSYVGLLADSDWDMDEFDGPGSMSANSEEAEVKMMENDVKMEERIRGDDVEESKPMGMCGSGRFSVAALVSPF
jgi:hypothetical protein